MLINETKVTRLAVATFWNQMMRFQHSLSLHLFHDYELGNGCKEPCHKLEYEPSSLSHKHDKVGNGYLHVTCVCHRMYWSYHGRALTTGDNVSPHIQRG